MNFFSFINENLYQECQLISALNAYRFLHKKNFCEQGDEVYEELVDLVLARDGAAVCIEKAYRRLGLKVVGMPHFLLDVEDLFQSMKLPIQMNVWHKKVGFHCCLIVGYSKQCRAFQVANFQEVTTADGWVFAEDLYQWRSCINCDDRFVVFGLRGRDYSKEKRRIKKFTDRFRQMEDE